MKPRLGAVARAGVAYARQLAEAEGRYAAKAAKPRNRAKRRRAAKQDATDRLV